MRLKYIYPAALVAALLLVGGVAFWPSTATMQTSVAVATTTPRVPVSNPTSSPTPVPSTYALADVAQHNSQASCWTTINGSVYDLTSFISQHPGGERAILSICGIDGTQAFEAQHGSQGSPNAILATLKIGTLAP